MLFLYKIQKYILFYFDVYYDVNDYERQCEEIPTANGTREVCNSILVGTHTENQITDWKNFKDISKLKSGNITIGIFTDVSPGESVEWIPTLFGERVPEWASWTESLNTNILAYWDFTNDSSTNIPDNVNGKFNMTMVEGACNPVGKIGTGIGYQTNCKATHSTNPQALALGTGNNTISFWFNRTGTVAKTSFILNFGTAFSATEEGSVMIMDNDADDKVTGYRNFYDTGDRLTIEDTLSTLNTWHHYAQVRTDGNVILYKDGVLQDVSTTFTGNMSPSSITEDDIEFLLRGATYVPGNLDEVGVWNRSMSETEITQLYNSGTGITYTTRFIPVTLNSPVDSFSTASSDIVMNCSAVDNAGVTNPGVANISLIIDGVINQTISNTTANENIAFQDTITFADGTHTWNCNATNFEDGFGNGTQRTLTIDSTSPVMNLSSPTGDQGSFVIGNNLSANWKVSDTNLDSCWIDYNSVNTTVTCGNNNYSFITVVDKQSLIFYANDTSGNLGSNSTSWTYSFLENNITFNTEVFETSHQNFVLNLTTDETILSVNGDLNYDGSNYLSTIVCNSGNCLLSNNIDIPIVDLGVSDDNEFFWNFTIFNGTASSNIKTSTNNQTVNKTYLELCNATHTIETLNFTSYDEINLSKLSNFQFDSTFNFWIGNGGVKRNNTYSTNGSEVDICMNVNLNYSVDSKIDYDEYGNTTTYTSRFYYMQNKSIDGTMENISLYLLPSASSTSFILKVQDQNLLPVEQALINIQRCYADELDCRTVQIAKTDENGKSIGFFQTETVDYKFTIIKNGETLLETGTQKVIPESSPFTLTFNIGDDLGSPWKGSEDIASLDSTLVFDKDAKVVTYSYIDTSTNFTSANLTVTKNSLSNSSATSIICSEVSTLSSSTITCDVGNTTGFYTASGYITRSGTALDKQISFQIEDVSSIVGLLGLFYGFFFVLVLVFMFKFNEIAGIWLMVIGIILLNITGLIKFGMVFVTAIIVLAIIITWLLEK